MERASLRSWLVVLCMVPVIAVAGCSRASLRDEPASHKTAPVLPVAVYDRQLTDIARVLAGRLPERPGRFAKVTTHRAWLAYAAEFDRTWAHADQRRMAAMRSWRDAELNPSLGGRCGTLLYPFSGPDIVNAQVLFPDCARYVMFGLEHTGTLPRLDQMGRDRIERLVGNLKRVVGDLFERNYFITRRMEHDLETPELEGTLPILALLAVRAGSRIVSVTTVDLMPDGTLRQRATPAPANPRAIPAVRLETLSATGLAQEIMYCRLQAEDASLARHPGFLVYLATQRPYWTMIKSASYLLHHDSFSQIRRELLAGSSIIVQDDTGIPFRFLDTPEWDVRLYGKYAEPIKEFKYASQPDLAEAFSTPGRAHPLLFSYGYHWRDGTSHVMVAVRQPAAGGTGAARDRQSAMAPQRQLRSELPHRGAIESQHAVFPALLGYASTPAHPARSRLRV